MQQEKATQQAQDLQELEQLVRFPLKHTYSGLGKFRLLAYQYPVQFIYLMRQYRGDGQPRQNDLLDRSLPQVIHTVNNSYRQLQRFWLHPPKNAAEQAELEKIASLLQPLLERQCREN